MQSGIVGLFGLFVCHFVFRTPFQRTSLDGLYVLEALVLSNRAFFFLGILLFKELSEKTHTFILTSMKRKNPTIAFHHVFVITLYALTLQKLFFIDKV